VSAATFAVAAPPIEPSGINERTTASDAPRERKASMKSKRQTTRAKLERERLVQERRALKREKKQAAAGREAQTGDATRSSETVA
jgi:hypothetical protein